MSVDGSMVDLSDPLPPGDGGGGGPEQAQTASVPVDKFLRACYLDERGNRSVAGWAGTLGFVPYRT